MEPISPVFENSPLYDRSNVSPTPSLYGPGPLSPIAEELEDLNIQESELNAASDYSLGLSSTKQLVDSEPLTAVQGKLIQLPTTPSISDGQDACLTDSVLLLTDQLLTVTKQLYSLADTRFAEAEGEFEIPRTFCTSIDDKVVAANDPSNRKIKTSEARKQLSLAENRLALANSQAILAENRRRLARTQVVLAESRVAFAKDQLASARERGFSREWCLNFEITRKLSTT